MDSCLIKGILIGLVFGVPVGAIGALTIKRTITYGISAGLITGFGCSAADLIYSCVSVFGLTLISDFMMKYQSVISFIGGAFVIIMGIGIIKKKQDNVQDTASAGKLAAFFALSFLIAITNPATIVSFLLAFSMFDVGTISGIQGAELIAGIFLGACIWCVVISLAVYAFRKRITDKRLRIINRVLGTIIILFGISVITKTIF